MHIPPRPVSNFAHSDYQSTRCSEAAIQASHVHPIVPPSSVHRSHGFNFLRRVVYDVLGSPGRRSDSSFSANLWTHGLCTDYGARSWRYQWWLLDGWLALLYLIDFVAIAYLWRPSPNNRRYVPSLSADGAASRLTSAAH